MMSMASSDSTPRQKLISLLGLWPYSKGGNRRYSLLKAASNVDQLVAEDHLSGFAFF